VELKQKFTVFGRRTLTSRCPGRLTANGSLRRASGQAYFFPNPTPHWILKSESRWLQIGQQSKSPMEFRGIGCIFSRIANFQPGHWQSMGTATSPSLSGEKQMKIYRWMKPGVVFSLSSCQWIGSKRKKRLRKFSDDRRNWPDAIRLAKCLFPAGNYSNLIVYRQSLVLSLKLAPDGCILLLEERARSDKSTANDCNDFNKPEPKSFIR